MGNAQAKTSASKTITRYFYKLLPGGHIGDVVHDHARAEAVDDDLVGVAVHEHLRVGVRRHVRDLVPVPSGHDERNLDAAV